MFLKSIQMEKDNIYQSRPRFASQWAENDLSGGQRFEKPSETVPDQALTIPEIIAKFTRTGQVPGSIRFRDDGGNLAADPESDPLDDYQSVMAAKSASGSSPAPQEPAGEPESPAPAPAGA